MPDPNAEEKPEEKNGTQDAIAKTLEDIKAGLDNLKPKEEERPPAPSGASAAERRASLQKSLGYTDEQMAAHEESILRAQGPVIENIGWTRLEKKADIDTYRKEIEQELSIYPQERRTPEIMEKIYLMVRGKHADSKPAPDKTPPSGRPGERVSRGPGYSGADPGLPAGGEGGSEEDALNDEEKLTVAKLREAGADISDKEYAASRKAGKFIKSLKPKDTFVPQGRADLELARMKRGSL